MEPNLQCGESIEDILLDENPTDPRYKLEVSASVPQQEEYTCSVIPHTWEEIPDLNPSEWIQSIESQRFNVDRTLDSFAAEQGRRPALELNVRREFFQGLKDLRETSSTVRKMDRFLERMLNSLEDLDEEDSMDVKELLMARAKVVKFLRRFTKREERFHRLYRRFQNFLNKRSKPSAPSLEDIHQQVIRRSLRLRHLKKIQDSQGSTDTTEERDLKPL